MSPSGFARAGGWEEPDEPAPRTTVLRARRDYAVVQPVLGLTLYLASDAWARGAVLTAFDAFVRCVGPHALRSYAVSTHAGWHALSGDSIERLRASLPLPWSAGRPRHLLRLRVADRTSAPTTAFTYWELDEAHAPCAGYLQCALPWGTPTATWGPLFDTLLACGPWWSGVGGALATVSELERPTSFTALRAQCRRFVGLDVQVPEELAFCARDGIGSVGWLTAVGAPLLEAKPAEATRLRAPRAPDRVTLHETAHGVLVQAGDAPTLGDLNALRYPHAYCDAAHLLRGFLASDAPPFPEWGEAPTRDWRQRFLEPEGWR